MSLYRRRARGIPLAEGTAPASRSRGAGLVIAPSYAVSQGTPTAGPGHIEVGIRHLMCEPPISK